MILKHYLLFTLLPSLLFFYEASAESDNTCTATEEIKTICGFQRPEDLETINQNKWLLISEYGGIDGSNPGNLSIYDAALQKKRKLQISNKDAESRLGDPACVLPPGEAFSPHGIHYAENPVSNRLLVVNHGGREAIEIFSITNSNDWESVELEWEGCVVAPDEIWMNDVVGISANNFAVSHMVSRNADERFLIEASQSKIKTGWVMIWQQNEGWRKLKGSEGGLPNGMQISADRNKIYVNEYFGNKVVALDLIGGTRLWEISIPSPDNSSWHSNGNLLVASHSEPLKEVFNCNEHPLKPCKLRYSVFEINTSSRTARILFEGGGGDPMGAATVAIEYADRIYLGSFVGDRIVHRTYTSSATSESKTAQKRP